MTTETATAPPPARPAPPAPQAAALPAMFGKIEEGAGERIVLYGTGGIGKTTLAALAPGPVAFFDLDNSLPVLGSQLKGLDIHVVQDVSTLQGMQNALRALANWNAIQTLVIDSFTRAEELVIAHTLQTVLVGKSHVTSIEGYGYAKGYTYVYEAFLRLLADLDQHASKGRNVILICHDCTAKVANPGGEDWLRDEPRLQSRKDASTRLRVKEWADHVLAIRYDVSVDKGKATSTGSRAIYPIEQASFMAKSRTLRDTIVYEEGSTELWDKLFGKEST